MEPFRSAVSQDDINDLRTRLRQTRLPHPSPVQGWVRGVPVEEMRDLVESWLRFDWHVVESKLNAYPQFLTEIDGARIHLIHVRSPDPDAVPLILTHGWPGSVLDFLDIIPALVDPQARGLDQAQAFHVVIPSLPGFGFSCPVDEPGWDLARIARAWRVLMDRLGYAQYFAQGSDLGTPISLAMAAEAPERVLGVTVNFLLPTPEGPSDLIGLGQDDLERLRRMGQWVDEQSGYMWLQATAPQTLAYSLSDSPAGQLAWIAEKYHRWSENGVPASISRDQLLAVVSLYWFTRTGGSSAHLYADSRADLPVATSPPQPRPPLSVPLGVSVHRHDISLPVRSLARAAYPGIRQWREHEHGGHFSALECPTEFVTDVRDFVETVLAEEAAS